MAIRSLVVARKQFVKESGRERAPYRFAPWENRLAPNHSAHAVIASMLERNPDR